MKKLILSVKKSSLKMLCVKKSLFVLVLLSCISLAASGQISVSGATNGANICSSSALDGTSPAATTLGTITVGEFFQNDFGNSGPWNPTTITLSPPTGWVFTGAVPAFNPTPGGDLATVAGVFSSGNLVITLTGSGHGHIDNFTITGLQINASHTTSLPGNITGTYLNVNGDGSENYASLALVSGPTAISGTLAVCAGLQTTLSSTPLGGTWTSSAPAIGSVNTSGVVTGIPSVTTTSTVSVTYATACGTTLPVNVTVNPLPAAIGGALTVCAGSMTTLNSTPAGGTWSSSGTNGSIDPVSGIVTGITGGGTTPISYTLGTTCAVGAVVTVNVVPSNITGTLSFCAGQGTTLNSTPAGGAWNSSNGTASIGSGSGIVTSSVLASGTATISYTKSGCQTMAVVTVNPQPTAITGTLAVCANATTTLNSTPAGGAWSSSNANALIDGSGDVTAGATAGNAAITYALGSCTATATVTVIALAATPTGALTICKNLTTTLNSTPAGGTWASSNGAAATVNPATGVVTGVNAGTTLVSYTTGCGASAAVTVTVNPLPPTINGSPAVCVGSNITLTDTDPTGTWSSSNLANGTVGSLSGTVTGIHTGPTTITFTDNTTGCLITTVLTINPVPSVTSASNTGPVCVGTPLTLNNVASGITALHYVWTGPNTFSTTSSLTASSTFTTATSAANGIYTVTATDNNGCSAFNTTNASVSNIPTLTGITSDMSTYCSTNPVILTAAGAFGNGSVISYNWSGPALATTTTAANSKTIASVTTAGAGIYSVTVTYTGTGCTSTTYTTTPVAVNPTPTITVTGKSICSGGTVDLFLNVTTPSNISWTIGSNPGNNISGFSASSGGEITDALTNASNSTANTLQYLVTPVSAVLNCPGVTASVVITVNPTPVMTATTSATTCGALSLPLTASAPSNFSWTIGTISPFPTSISNASNGSGSTINQTLANTSNSTPGSVQYIVTPTSQTGGCSGSSETITVTVNPGPALTSQTNVSVCSGLPLSIPLTSTASANFNWTVGTASSGISGASSGSGTIITGTLNNSSNTAYGTQVYNVTPVSSSGGCSGSTVFVTVTVNPLPSVTTSTSQSTCSGIQLNIGLTASIPGSTFTWGESSEQSGITGATSGLTATINDVLLNSNPTSPGKAVYSVRATSPSSIGSCLSAAPTLVTVTVNPTPVMTSTNTVTTCGAVNLPLTSSTAGTTGNTFVWTAGATTGTISGASDGSGNNFIQSLSNGSNSVVATAQYTITPTSVTGACLGIGSVVTVSVNPAPSVSNGGQSVCSGSLLTINLESSTSSNFTWTVANTGGMTGGHGSTVAGTTITDYLVNSSNTTPGFLTYSVTPTSSGSVGCTGASSLITVTVNPLPGVSTPTSQAICSGIAMNIGLAATITGSTFTWGVTSESSGISGGTNGTTTITDILSNTSHTNIGTATYTVLPTSPASIGSCTAATPTTVTVSVYPTPVMTSTLIATTCSSVNIPLTASTASTTGSNFAWTVIDPGTTLGASGGGGSNFIQTLTDTSNSAVASVLYSVTPTSSTGSCLGISSIVTVNVNPSPVLQSGGTSVCSGSGLSLPLNPSTPSSFTWTVESAGSISGGTAGSGTTITDPLTNPSNSTFGTLTYSVTPTSTVGGCAGSSSLVTVTVNPLPAMSASSATVCSGTALGINLTTIGGLASNFVWGENFVSTGTITGYNTNVASPSITDLLVNSDHSAQGTVIYTVIPTSTAANGSCTAASVATITVSVNPTPLVTSASNITICSNTSTSYSITATDSSNYSWTIGTIFGSIGVAYPDVGTVINQPLTDSSHSSAGSVQYLITPTSTIGRCVGPIFPLSVVVNPSPVVTTATSASVCNSAQLSIPLASSTYPEGTFNWTVGTITGAIAGANGGSGPIVDTLFNPSPSSPGTVVYNVTAISAIGSCTSVPTAITVVVNPSPVVTNATSASTCSDVSPNITLTASTASTFAWGANTVSGVINATTGNNTSLINDLLHNISNTVPGNVIDTIRATSNSGACVSLTLTTINVVVNPTPVITSAFADTVCSGVGLDINLVASTGPDATFAWGQSFDPGGITGASANTTPLINDVLTNPNSAVLGVIIYTVLPTSHIGCIPDSTTKIAVVVNPAPNVTTTLSQSTCSDTRLGIALLSSTDANSTFKWVQTFEHRVTGGSTTVAVTDTINDLLHNLSDSVSNIVVYSVTPRSLLGCFGSPALITVSVNPLPVITGGNTAICSGLNPGININLVNLTSTPSICNWQVSDTSGAFSDNNSGTLTNTIAPVLTNTGNSTIGTVTFSISPTSNLGCPGPSHLITVSVNPIPKLRSSDTLAMCSEGRFPYNAASSTALTKFYWSRPSFDASITGSFSPSPADSSGAVNDSISSNHLLTRDYVIYPFTLKSRGCISDTNVVFTVNPRPEKPFITLSADTSLCANTFFQNFSANAPADASLVLYEWTATHATVYDTNTAEVNRNILVSFDSAGVTSVVTVSAHVATFTCYSDSSVSIKVNGTPADAPATILYRNGLFICEKNNVDTPNGYKWGYDSIASLRSVVLPNEINQSYYNPKPDTNNLYYWVEVIHNGCPQKSYYITPGSTRLRATTEQAPISLRVYPNPAQTIINIDLGDVSGGDFSTDIFDITGRKLMTASNTSNITQLSVENFSPGYYIIECRKNGIKVAVAKFIKN